MEVRPLASDSMGTRSMATYVETNDFSMVIDPGVALGPIRYRLPPHPLEFQRMDEHWEVVKKKASKADILVVTHYHYDHHDPDEAELFRGKRVFLKHPTEKINKSQTQRAAYFLEHIEGYPRELVYADGKSFEIGGTKVKFSEPVPHGPGTRLGYVVQVYVEDGDESFLFSSDIEGPCVREQAEFILDADPALVYIDGPLSYMLGYRYSQESLDESVRNMIRILGSSRLEKLMVDHHLLRDLKWRERISQVFEEARVKKKKVLTAAEFNGLENDTLEARRRELYLEHPPKAVPRKRERGFSK